MPVPGTSFAKHCNQNDTFPLSRGRFHPTTMTMRKLNILRILGTEFLFSSHNDPILRSHIGKKPAVKIEYRVIFDFATTVSSSLRLKLTVVAKSKMTRYSIFTAGFFPICDHKIGSL